MAALAWVKSVEQGGAEDRPRWLAWIEAARAGDRGAFAALHGHFKGLVHAVILAKVPSSEAADLTQDVFVVMLARLSGLKDDRAFPAWLMQLARTRALTHLRDRRPQAPLPAELSVSPDPSAAPDARRILQAIQALPETYAETLAMRLVEGLTGPEIAERTGLTPGSVRVNLHRGMALLRQALGVPAREEGERA